ncbi:MAG TPA: SPOR domain-containing protein [Methylomirabilota bacterium]|jgi:cell division septation protein DedD
MMSARRLGRPRHEFRFGGRELVVLGVVFCLIVSLVFVAGVMVGRESARPKGAARADAGREHRLPEPDALRGVEAAVKTAATRAEEKVTFYRTLTAPTQDLPQVGKPTIEERLVPKDEPATAPAADATPEASPAAPEASRAASEPPRAAPESPRPAPERRTPKVAVATPSSRPPRATRAAAAAPTRSAPTHLAAATGTADSEAWTVQVSAFRSRALAEDLRARLAARGFDAYVFPSITEEGRPRYRVRVGTFPARGDAERVAADLRSERGLSPVVTPRTR